MRQLATIILTTAAFFTSAVSAAETNRSVVKAEAIIDAIWKGENLSSFVSGMNVQDAELAEFAALAGCRPEVGRGSSKSYLFLIYGCASTRSPQAPAGYLLEIVLEKETLEEIWLTPEGALPPTDQSLAGEMLPNRTTIGKNFVAAIGSGNDPTVRGLIALTPSQRRRLSAYEGCSPSILQPGNRQKSMYRWRCKERTSAHETMTELHFDDQGRPVGLSFAKLVTRPVHG